MRIARGRLWPAWDPKQFGKSVNLYQCSSAIELVALLSSVLLNFGVVSVLTGKCGMLLLCSIALHCICQVFCSFCAGVEPMQVQETVENHLKSLLIKHFDPRKADSIFTEEGEVCACNPCCCLCSGSFLDTFIWWSGEGKLNLHSSWAEEQLVSENQLCLTGDLRGLENLEIWNPPL